MIKKDVNMKLAIATLMLACVGKGFASESGMPYPMPDHDEVVLATQMVEATKDVKKGGDLKVSFKGEPDEVLSGVQRTDVSMFTLTVSDSAYHTGFRFYPIGPSTGSFMVHEDGTKVKVGTYNIMNADWSWNEAKGAFTTTKEDSKPQPLTLKAPKGSLLKAGVYHFSGMVEEYY
ncbi:MyfA/PsaA family fimbrial adhesin [Salmonella enterica]|nr:MyfA/PsaA family fimbrial adhesin [Salmonella enterica]EIA4659114.1 MyfA/PsaA family fimbrial adhesin [Salmonella enterica]EJI5637383.1 MyfA/PsaA family fimbrial adhesin [Salmonella enterica]EJP9626291.1 MyfA/PsaA family fimbrial adhesin [Salmonella enterica]